MVKNIMTNDLEEENYNETKSRIKIVTKPEDIKILVDPMRRKILTALREGIEEDDGTIRKEMTVLEIAYRKLGLKEKQASKLYHHIDKLLKSGFLRIAREEKKTRSTITYYERTAPAFVLASTIDEVERQEGIRTTPLISFINDGFNLRLSQKEQDEVQILIDEYTTRQHKYIVSAAQKLKGNIPEDRLRDVLIFMQGQYASQDKRCQEIRSVLTKYIKIEL
ncbi:MAG: helix-turn-helix transcriptional regulator [Asgard group archaeon]|nr:helix-turn-helix transcriptional regulator [Asgard group archaeon]